MLAPGRVLSRNREGKVVWAYRGESKNMYQICHDEFFAAIRAGKQLNAGEYMANTTMLGILGREVAHSGQRITWEQLWKSEQSFGSIEGLALKQNHPVQPVPAPGKYKFR